MATNPLFPAFMQMLKELGIDAQGDHYEVMQKERRLYVELEKVSDFPVSRLPEIREHAIKTEALNPGKLIGKMRQLLAQGPKKTTTDYSDDFIRNYYMRLLDRTPEGEHKERYRKVAS